MNPPVPPSAVPRPKHRLLALLRRWHLWGGVIAALFLLVFGLTGIVLNYKKPIFSALGLERDAKKMEMAGEESGKMEKAGKPAKRDKKFSQLHTTTGFAAATVSVDQALALARENLGEVALERIELKDEDGELIYKIKSRGGEELRINALTGAHFIKGRYEKVKTSPDGAVMARTTDWGKIMIDLHTGQIGGEIGKAVMTVAAGLLLFLTVSGLYLWLKPLWIRRANARARAAAPGVEWARAAGSTATGATDATPHPPKAARPREMVEA